MKKAINTTVAAAAAFLTACSANAAEISTNTAIMQAMDKITGQVNLIEVPVNQEVVFGSLSIVVRECKTRTPEETPENFAFVDVVDKNTAIGDVNIFKGWMLSSSPALNPVAHPVYDVWLLKCANKLIDPKNLMSKEQLEMRDVVVMSRDATEKTLNEQAPQEETSEEASFAPNADGEPINLIPDDVADDTAENTAEAENVPSEPQSAGETAGQSSATQPTATDSAVEEKDGAPQALIDFSAQETVETVPETAVQEADFETIDLDETASAEKPAAAKENSAPAAETSASSEVPPAKAAAPENDAAQAAENAAQKQEPSAEAAPANTEAENNEDIINRLEQELSAQLIGE